MKFAQVNNTTIHYKVEGANSGLPLVFINSLGSDNRIWNQVIPHFAGDYPIIRYDKRGHGLSDCPSAPYTMRDHSDDLHGLLHYLEIPEVMLIGISVGGQIALDFTLAYPELVAAAVLSDTAPKIGTPEMWNERIDTLRQHGMAHLGDAILARWFAPAFAEQQAAAYRGYYNMLTRTPLEGYTGTCEAIRDFDVREAITAITIKALVICGEQDLATTPEQGKSLAQNLPNAQYVEIEGAAHLPCIEQPDAMADAIHSFLERITNVR